MHAAEISALQTHHILCDNGSFSPFLLMNSSMILHAIHQQSTPTSTMERPTELAISHRNGSEFLVSMDSENWPVLLSKHQLFGMMM